MGPFPILPPNPHVEKPPTQEWQPSATSIADPNAPDNVENRSNGWETDQDREKKWVEAGVLEPPAPPPPPVPFAQKVIEKEPPSRAQATPTRLELAVGPWYPLFHPPRTRLTADLGYWATFFWSFGNHNWGPGFLVWNGIAVVQTKTPYGDREPLVAETNSLSLGVVYSYTTPPPHAPQSFGFRWSRGVGVYPVRWVRSYYNNLTRPAYHTEARNRRAWNPLGVVGHGALWWGFLGRLEVGLWAQLGLAWPTQIRASWGLALAASLPGSPWDVPTENDPP